MRVLIVGCGYVGIPLGAELVRQGHEVFGVRRDPMAAAALTAAGNQPVFADLTRAEELGKLPERPDWVVFCAAAGPGGTVADYRAVYHDGNRHLLAWLAAHPPRKYIYTSSTSVYGQTDGSAVKESSPTIPDSPTSQVLLEAEKVLLDAAGQSKFPAVVLRVAGIYGPDRGHWFRQYLKNQAVIPGQGERIMNMVHRDDVVSAITAALKNGRPGEVYNVVDDEPVALIHFFRWLSETLGKWMPPFGPEESDAGRKRAITNKKVQNRKLKMEIGLQFKYSNFRKGYTAEIQRLDLAGELHLEPEAR